LAVIVELHETRAVLRLKGCFNVNSAAELKRSQVECLESGKALSLNLEDAEEIDISTVQLLWATGREAERVGVEISSRVSPAAARAATDAGFPSFPVAVQE
jgi:anti-anti-sigma regulatory factor